MSERIRVILYKRGNKWLAQGLERAISAQADTLDALYMRFDATVRFEKSAFGGLGHIPPSPNRFFEMWEQTASNPDPVEEEDAGSFDYRMVA